VSDCLHHENSNQSTQQQTVHSEADALSQPQLDVAEGGVEVLVETLTSDTCSVRDGGVQTLFQHHLQLAIACVQSNVAKSNCATQYCIACCNVTCQFCATNMHILAAHTHTSTEGVEERDQGRRGEGDTTCACNAEQGLGICVGVCVSDFEFALLERDCSVCLGLLELTRTLLVHYKMQWAGSAAPQRTCLALRLQLLVSHRLEVAHFSICQFLTCVHTKRFSQNLL